MKIEIRNALTRNDCSSAISLSSQLYASAYSDNDVRMLYVSAQACNSGIFLFTILNNLTTLSVTNPIADFVHYFPSTLTDSRLQSAWYGLDALQTVLNPGAVVGASDQVIPNAFNIGSDLIHDRTLDAQVYGMFVSMAIIGETGNRYGSPNASYGQTVDFSWITKAAVQADTTGTACALASAFLNFFDSAQSSVSILPSAAASVVNSIITAFEGPLLNAGTTQCTLDGFSGAQCTAAAARLRYRNACGETGAIASYAAGIIQGANLAWQ